MDAWEQNQSWMKLPKPEVGDIVQLKLVDVFDYLVDASVATVNDTRVTARVEAMFDYRTRVPLTGGKKLRLIGKRFSFKQELIHNVIKKN